MRQCLSSTIVRFLDALVQLAERTPENQPSLNFDTVTLTVTLMWHGLFACCLDSLCLHVLHVGSI